MSNFCIKVEPIASSDLQSALTEAKEKVKLWDVAYIEFKFNGTTFRVNRRPIDWEKVWSQFFKGEKFISC